jgi:hypothetical protein
MVRALIPHIGIRIASSSNEEWFRIVIWKVKKRFGQKSCPLSMKEKKVAVGGSLGTAPDSVLL